MRLAHFIQRYPPARGGSEAYFRRLSRFCAAKGDSVTVWTTAAYDLTAFWSPGGRCLPAGTEDDAGVTVRRYPLWRMTGRRWLLKPLSMVPYRAWQAMTLPCNPVSAGMWRDAGRCTERYDAVHAAAFPYAWPIVCARRLARRLDVPFLLSPFLHVGDPTDDRDRTRRQYLQPALRSVLRSADRVFVQTQLERHAVIDAGVHDERITLQGLGVEPDECMGGDRRRARAAWGVGDNEVVVGHLANLSAEKGSVDLLRAAESLPARFVLAGPRMPNFDRRAVFTALPGREGSGERGMPRPSPNPSLPGRGVIIAGELDDRQKRDFFAGIDIFALPSRSDSFGLVLPEAWANGVPVVAYRAGGPAELVRHGTDGFLARCGDVAELTACLSKLIGEPYLRRQLGEAGRQRVPREFTWSDKLELVRQSN